MQSKNQSHESASRHHLFVIDETLQNRLTAFAKIGIGFKCATEKANVAPRTVVRAAARQGKVDWLCTLFPASAKTIRRDTNIERLQALYFKALTMRWLPSQTPSDDPTNQPSGAL